jgi:predicted chitinase
MTAGNATAQKRRSVDSVNTVWLAASFVEQKELKQAIADFRGATKVELIVACQTNEEQVSITEKIAALFKELTSKKAGASNSMSITLSWKKATVGGYYIDSISVKPNLINGLFPDSAIKVFCSTVEKIREDSKVVAHKQEVTAHKKIAAELQTLKKQVKGVTVTIDSLKKVFPNVSAEVVEALNKHSAEFGITTPDRMAHFLGQIGAETDGLKELKEKCSYTAKNVFDVFLSPLLINSPQSTTTKIFKYCDLIESITCNSLNSCPGSKGYMGDCDSTVSVKLKNGSCAWAFENFDSSYNIKSSYIGSCELFDYVYGCRMGNGAKSTKDGSTYLGKGFIHLTGKNQYKVISDKWNKLYPNDKKEFHGADINLLETNVDVAMKASMIYWEMNGLNTKADEGVSSNSITSVGAAINGADPPNGQKLREKYTADIYKQINK